MDMISARRASPRIISRLSLYRRLLVTQLNEGVEQIYSHELARLAGVSAAQVRRDLMELGHSGTPNSGYAAHTLMTDITACLDAPAGQQVALVGIGNLGHAILAYFSSGERTKLRIVAAFDTQTEKVGQVLHGCHCYPLEEMSRVIDEQHITVGIIAVPPEAAQTTADQLVAAGVTGILNFAAVPIKVPDTVYVDHLDITIKLETVAYFAR